jgi:CheY-like chemotaxis protein
MSDDPRPRILCVDDDQNVLDGLRRTLRSIFVVETAIGGRLGLEILKARGPFVVVTSDLRMPLMDGVEFLPVRGRLPRTQSAFC